MEPLERPENCAEQPGAHVCVVHQQHEVAAGGSGRGEAAVWLKAMQDEVEDFKVR